MPILIQMAVSALPRTRTHAQLHPTTLSPVVLALTLIAPALDLLSTVLHGALGPAFGIAATSVATAALIAVWVRFPRTSWLAAAVLAGLASVGLRLIGVELAPVLSLLSVVALGIGGAFATPARDAQAWAV